MLFPAVLFVVVNPMSFALACIAVCLYSASSQVLSLDRTVGGRLFSGALFLGCMMSSGVLGGGLASLAWLARGDAEGLMQRIPSFITDNVTKNDITELQQWLPRLAAVPLPGFIRDIFDAVAAEAAALERSLFPMPDAAFWALLMVLFAVAVLPFAVARADANQQVGLLMGIATLFLGSLVIFGSLLPTLGLHLYWTQAVAGYIKVGLVCAGAMTLAALLLLARSSHDEVRDQLGRLLQGVGALAGRVGSVAAAPSGDGGAGGEPHSEVLGQKDEEEIKAAMARDARALAAALMPAAAADLGPEKAKDVETAAATPAPETALQLRARAEGVEAALASALFEPPLLGIASQPGSNRGHYAALLRAVEGVIGALGSLDACAADAQLELAGGGGSASSAAAQTALALCTAAVAASCAEVSVALRHMPLRGPCSGPALPWRPRGPEVWRDLEAELQRAAEALQPDADGAVAASVFIDGRAAVAAVACCETLLRAAAAMEAAAAVALAVAPPPPPEAPLSFKDKVAGNAYAPGALILVAMGLGLPIWALAVKATMSVCRGTVAFCRSSTRRAELLRDRGVQYAAKYWIGTSLAVVTIILVLWKGEGSGAASPLTDLSNMDHFFVVWQPLYAWISVSICTQQFVEASALRGVLRVTMTALGGTFGYLAMLNGSLAQNPYFVTGIVVAFNTVESLLSPLRSLRYSLFLAACTFNGVVACQYVGCCDVAGDPDVFGGKVLSTLLGVVYAMVVSWCFAPYYTSEKMLGEEAGALAAGVALVRRQLAPEAAQGVDGGWECAVEEGLRAPLGSVHKNLENNVVDRHQLMLTWTVLPTPPVVAPLGAALSRMADLLAAAGSVSTAPNLWPGPPGPAQVAMMDALGPQIQTVLAAADATVGACAACMAATTWKAIKATREEVSLALEGLWAARAALRAEFVAWNGRGERPGWTLPDLRFLSWTHLLLLALREVDVCAVMLAEGEASLDRDGYFSWAAAACGRRPAAANV